MKPTFITQILGIRTQLAVKRWDDPNGGDSAYFAVNELVVFGPVPMILHQIWNRQCLQLIRDKAPRDRNSPLAPYNCSHHNQKQHSVVWIRLEADLDFLASFLEEEECGSTIRSLLSMDILDKGGRDRTDPPHSVSLMMDTS